MSTKGTFFLGDISKVVLSALLMGSMSIGVAGCGNKTDNSIDDMTHESEMVQNDQGEHNSTNTEQLVIEGGSANIENSVEVTSDAPFSEGLAWVHYDVDDGEDRTTWAGYVDKTGRLIFRYKEFYGSAIGIGWVSGTDFQNGHAYITSNMLGEGNTLGAKCWVIDKNGRVVSEFENTVCMGGGYVVTSDHNANFDKESYTYRLLTDDGKEISSFESDGAYNEINYCGEGVFSFGELSQSLSGSRNHDISFLYNAGTNKKIEFESTGLLVFDSKTKYALYDYSNDDDYSYIRTISTDGTTKEYAISEKDLDGHLDSAHLDGDICTIFVRYDSNLDAQLFTYNLTSGELHELDHKYADAASSSSGKNLEYARTSEGRCVLEMKGADGDNYIGIFDTELNPVVEPFKATSYIGNDLAYSSDGRLLLGAPESNGANIYDLDGKLVYSAETLGATDGYQDGSLVYLSDGQVHCRDLQGNIVFDEISGFDAPEIPISDS